MKKQIEDIKQFQTVFECNVVEEPKVPKFNIINLRNKLILEEVEELYTASLNDDIVECLDAITDILYILLGTACEYGLHEKLEEAWNMVHESNMSKVGPDGKIIRREDGKILKPDTYKKVNLKLLFESGRNI